MSIKLSEYKLVEMNKFTKTCQYLVKYIRATWNYEGLEPKPGISEKDALVNFQGPNTATPSSFAAELRLTKCHVELDKAQGRDTLTSLVSACIAYGMVIENERQKRINNFNDKAEYFYNSIGSDKSDEEIEKEFEKAQLVKFQYSDYDVAQWEDNWEGFLINQRKEYSKVSDYINEMIKTKNASE